MSSCLGLKLRLPPAKKAWKTFISKLKIIQLHQPKSLKKRPHQNVIQTHHRNRKSIVAQRKRRNPLRFSLFKKKAAAPAPVYIDKLFKEPASADEILEQIRLPAVKNSKVNIDDEAAGTSSTSNEGGDANCMGDDMWESLGFASPLLRGIDERAEEFIGRFRAEMELQEILARHL